MTMALRHTDTDDDAPYPTDDFGRPDGRDYHYRIPLNDDRAMRLATWALNEMVHYSDRFVTAWDDYSGDSLSYMGLQTHDSKGHLQGLAEFAHSPRWKDAGRFTDVSEYRQNTAGGGTKLRGTFRYDPTGTGFAHTIEFETVVDLTPTEFEAAMDARGDDWDSEVRPAIRWAKDDAIEAFNQARAEAQQECEHDHTVGRDSLTVTHSPNAVAFCEDCGAEIDDAGCVVWG